MKWASAGSAEPVLQAAVRATTASVREQLGGDAPALVVAFVSEHHRQHYDRVPELLAAELGPGLLVGCSAGGVIGGGREIEQSPGLSVTAAVLPNVQVNPLHLEANAPHGPETSAALPALGGVAAPHFLLFPDPMTFDPQPLLQMLDRTYPAGQKIGGLASGGQQPGANALFLGSNVYRAGLVGIVLSGDIEVDTIVAQGCRPIGQPMFVTKCQGNLLAELDGVPAVRVLQELFEGLSSADQELAQHSLFVGIVMSEDQQEYRQGDFLIRNLIGMDAARGVLAVGALLRENSVVQFHLRDAKTSADDLEHLLTGYAGRSRTHRPQGALLFSCLGRGMHLYGRPDHDTRVFARHLGKIPLGGFFCNGEIGPVHGSTFLHGYTSAFGLFRSRS